MKSFLRLAPALKEAKQLRRELATFKVKITLNANESYEAWRNSDRDDTVLSVLPQGRPRGGTTEKASDTACER